MRYKILMFLIAFFTFAFTGCASSPDEEMSEARNAVDSARDKKDCAQDKFDAAERLLTEAQELNEEGDYDAARRKANAAKKLAEEAKAEAEANWEDCQRDQESEELATDRQDDDKPDEETEEEDEAVSVELGTIYFGYDVAELSDSAREQLQKNAEWLEQNPDATLVLEGHTDERGSVQYNIALGEQRAQSAQAYLIQLGVSKDRLKVLSYGEEKPKAYGSTPKAYGKNRRVEFVPQNR